MCDIEAIEARQKASSPLPVEKKNTFESKDEADFNPTSLPNNSSNNLIVSNQSPSPFVPQNPASHQNQVVNPDAKNGDVSREEIIHTIFGDVGELINDFSCAVESTVLLHGRMYITNRFLCFYSNLFGLEKKIRVPFSHIHLVTKENTAIVIPNAIAVTTHRKEYLFRSFWDRDECFRLLQELISRHRYSDNNQANPADASKDPVPGGAITHTPSFDANREGLPEGSGRSVKSMAIRSITPVRSSPSNSARPVSTGSTSSSVTTNSASSNQPEDGLKSAAADVRNNRAGSTEEESDIETSTLVGGGTRNEEKSSSEDYAAQYQEEVNHSKLKIVINTPEPLPISIKDFIALFLDDNAPHSWKSYHESVGDTKFEVTPWHDSSTSLGSGREMKFVKPIPSIKSSTRGVKVQRYRRFGDYGLVICSSTRLEDVPASDSFSVEDMLGVKAIGEDKVALEITFEVKFIKSTMFRYVIESNTNSEMGKWLDAFYQKLKSICNNRMLTLKQASDVSRNDTRSRSRSDAGASDSPKSSSSHTKPKNNNTQPSSSPSSSGSSSSSAMMVEATPVIINKSRFDMILDKVNLSGGRVYWSSWLILTLSFLFFAYQCMRVNSKLRAVDSQIRSMQALLEAIHKKL